MKHMCVYIYIYIYIHICIHNKQTTTNFVAPEERARRRRVEEPSSITSITVIASIHDL